MSGPEDPADRQARAARTRAARASPLGAGTPAGPLPADGAGRPPIVPSGSLSPKTPEGTQTPAGGALDADSAPLAGQDWRRRVKAAQSAHAAAKRRSRFTRAAPRTGPGMIRKPPPDDGEAA